MISICRKLVICLSLMASVAFGIDTNGIQTFLSKNPNIEYIGGIPVNNAGARGRISGFDTVIIKLDNIIRILNNVSSQYPETHTGYDVSYAPGPSAALPDMPSVEFTALPELKMAFFVDAFDESDIEDTTRFFNIKSRGTSIVPERLILANGEVSEAYRGHIFSVKKQSCFSINGQVIDCNEHPFRITSGEEKTFILRKDDNKIIYVIDDDFYLPTELFETQEIRPKLTKIGIHDAKFIGWLAIDSHGNICEIEYGGGSFNKYFSGMPYIFSELMPESLSLSYSIKTESNYPTQVSHIEIPVDIKIQRHVVDGKQIVYFIPLYGSVPYTKMTMSLTEKRAVVVGHDDNINSDIAEMKPFPLDPEGGFPVITLNEKVKAAELNPTQYLTDSVMTSVKFGDTAKEVDEAGFWGQDFLSKVEFSNSITNIGTYAFAYCDSLTNILIPRSVEVFGDWIFAGCHNLKDVTFENRTKAEVQAIPSYNYFFENGTVVHCSDGDILINNQ